MQKLKNFYRHLSDNQKAFLLFLALALLAFWPATFGIFPFKYDMMDYYFPYRYYISESFRSGNLPFWSPYVNLGIPIHADPQSSVWYPVSWLVSILSGYSIYSIGLEFVVHIAIAGFGMFLLSKLLLKHYQIAVCAGIIYMFSGFFVGNAQHYSWIIAGSWLPWVIWAFLRLSHKANIKSTIILAFCASMFITGAYPAFQFVAFYFILILGIHEIIVKVRFKRGSTIKSYLAYMALALVFTIVLSGGYIVSILTSVSHFSRGDGVSLSTALSLAFTPKCFISFIFPFASVNKDMAFFNTDMSMSNAYMGLLPFLLLPVSFFLKKDSRLWLFLCWGIFMMAVSVGEVLPFRAFLYKHIPLMDLFRFSSLFRIFALLSFIPLSVFAIKKILIDTNKYHKIAIYILGTLCILFIVLLFIIRAKGHLDIKQFLLHDWFNLKSGSGIRQHLALSVVIQIGILLLLIGALWWKKLRPKFPQLVIVILAFDMFLHLQLCMPFTVSHFQLGSYKPSNIQAYLNKQPKGFPAPNLCDSIGNNFDKNEWIHWPLYKNLGLYRKTQNYYGYTPFKLENYQELLNDKNAFNEVKSRPFLYFKNSLSDTLFSYLSIDAKISDYGAGFLTLDYSIAEDKQLHFSQNYYTGWKAYIDKKQVPILISNHSMMYVQIPKGQHRVQFIYQPTAIKLLFWISFLGFCSILIFIGLISLKRT